MKVPLPAGPKARIEIIPLIDIVFLLLVFFLYAMLAMAVHRGVAVTLPLSSSAAAPEKQDLVSISIRSDGQLYLDAAPVALADLTDRLRGAAPERKQSGLLLFADARVSYQQIFDVLDAVRAADISRISLQMEERPEP